MTPIEYYRLITDYLKRPIERKWKLAQDCVEEIVHSGTYLIYTDKARCAEAVKSLRESLYGLTATVVRVLRPNYISEKRIELQRYRQVILNYNKDFIEQRKKDYNHLWRFRGLHDVLDDEQQTAIVTDDKHNLVVAAAGSGKTEVLITRIVYLVKRKPDTVKQHRILAIAYQDKDVKQIEKRLSKYGITSVNAMTFHRLGIDILRRAGKMRSILGKNERPRLVREIYQDKLKSDSDFYHAFLRYVKSLHETEVEGDVTNKVSTLEMKRTLPYASINDIHVQSRAEKEILDFLLTSKLNGTPIQMEYEPQIEGLGKPDFFLPEYGLFIEHWGLNKHGEVPEWFDQSTAEYKENMERKKKWFDENNKLLVETFSYEYDEDYPESFIQILKDRIVEKLQSRFGDFHFSTMTYRELIEVVCESDRDWISEDRISKDIFNFIKNAKTYNLKPERILQKLESGKWSAKQRTFGKLAVEVYESYQQKLRELQKIDFEDMINNAIDELKKDKELCKNIYDHILVDEYQDITQQTHKLVKTLLNQNPTCKLFCVGDDWQSIMGFAGSNLEFFVNFGKYFDNPAIAKISTNYRSIGTIVDAGSCLIRNNSSCQIQKRTVSSDRKKEGLIKVLKLLHRISHKKNYHRQIAVDCINRVVGYRKKGYAPKDILILSRFKNVHTHQGPRHHYIIENIFEEADNKGIKISEYAKTKRNVRLLTVHKAKGLEAKVVFILNVIRDTYGFPCEIEDSSILEPARDNYPPQDQKEEERRLFYVAMTRSKEDLYIYTWKPIMSEFLGEIAGYIDEEEIGY